MPKLLWLLLRQNASPGFCQQLANFYPPTDPPASIWLSLLGMLSSMAHLVPGGRLRMRSLQLCLHQSWDRVDQSTRIPWSPDCLRDLQWWLQLPRLRQGVSLHQGVSRPGLLVRRLRRRLGGTLRPSHRFQPLEPRRSSAVHQCQETSGRPPWSPPLPVISSGEDGVGLLRQQHGGRLPSQGRGHQVSIPQLAGARDPPLVGVALHPSGSPVYSGVPQCPGGRSVSPSPAASY